MTKILAKKVSSWELFYDLIFVYAISRLTHMITHLHDGHFSMMVYAEFLIATWAIFQSWVFQTTIINKFSTSKLSDLLGLFINMFAAMYVSLNINTDWSQTFIGFNTGMLMMNGSLLLQLWLNWKSESSPEQKLEQRNYMILLGIGSLGILLGLSLGYWIGVPFVVGVYFLQALIPMLLPQKFSDRSLNFPHLVERLGLLTIITFGESIVTLVGLVGEESKDSLFMLLSFGLILILFWTYLTVTEGLMNHHQHVLGFFYMFLHYILITAVLTATAGWTYFTQVPSESIVPWLVISLSQAVIYLTLLGMGIYNKEESRFRMEDYLFVFIVYGIGIIATYFLRMNLIAYFICMVIYLGIIGHHFYRLQSKHTKSYKLMLV